uniref:Thyrotropin subunit beta n=1 Tax=Pavo cristatus TaxID=9049 RepID=A0A8C9FSY0_PAVCR
MVLNIYSFHNLSNSLCCTCVCWFVSHKEFLMTLHSAPAACLHLAVSLGIPDSNGKKLLLKSALSQNVCTYKEMLYQTALIPGCPHHTIPYYSYPVAVSCKCGKCNTDYSDCVHEKVRANYCTKPQKLCNM